VFAYANYKIKEENPNAIVVVAPSDHIILKEDEFVENIKTAMKAAQENNWLLTLGINQVALIQVMAIYSLLKKTLCS